jgi:transaldolase
MSTISTSLVDEIRSFVTKGIDTAKAPEQFGSDELWKSLRDVGTEIWLDTGDMDEAGELWSAEMSALTTNNTLLNNEVQKGIYDDLIAEANRMLGDIDTTTKVQEIAFILNARHGLRLAEKFGGKVSVELHTDLSHDFDGIVHYGERFHAIAPAHFVVKVPLTPTGLLGARALRDRGIPVNFTLEFSARQNVLVTAVARPNYCNVFLGRLNSVVKDHGLGSGDNVGEKTTIASQAAVHRAGKGLAEPTRQIAASMRSGAQVKTLAGIDVFTMPTKVARQAKEELSGDFADMTAEDLPVELDPSADPESVHIEKLWEVEEQFFSIAEELGRDVPETGEELARRLGEAGYGDLFPQLSAEDQAKVDADGKLPDLTYWTDRIRSGEVALDTLMNLAGLSAFTKDQTALDDRIRGIVGS